ncbi:AHH domain-containing protein [Aliikangiella maris]|uniref:AHH domain-containing protein n=2 Tax=Aliikangiella maris TaxID=3162458 RepID=A0ABV3MVF4_9GAMM
MVAGSTVVAEAVPIIALGVIVYIGSKEGIEAVYDHMLTPDISGTAGTPPPDDEDDVVDRTSELRVSRTTADRHLRNALNTPANETAHHIIPWTFRTHKMVELAAKGGFRMNGAGNGINMSRTAHGWNRRHAVYNRYIRRLLNREMKNNPDMTPQQAASRLNQWTRIGRDFLNQSTKKLGK